MTALSAFCARMGIDAAAARQALAMHAAHDDSPWYMQTVLGVGAWVTAIAGLFFAWAVMALVFDVEEPNVAIAIAGAAVHAASIWLLHHRPDGAFAAHVAVAFATAGTLLVAAGIGVPTESLWAAAIATLPFAAVAVWQRRSLLLQFLIVSTALILAIVAVWEEWRDVILDMPAVLVPFAVALLLYPPRLDLRPTAFALLLVPQALVMIASEFEGGWAIWYGWPAKGIYLAVFAFLYFSSWRRLRDPQTRMLSLAAAAAAAIVTFALPTGASAALVLLALAYTLGSRSLAAIGVLAEVYFIWQFYWDLQETLLTKSLILMGAGAALLTCYGLLIGAMRERRAP